MLGYKSLAAIVSFEMTKLARENDNVRAAKAAATHALTNTEPGDATVFAGGAEMARIQRKVTMPGALTYLKKVSEWMTRAHATADDKAGAKQAAQTLRNLTWRGQQVVKDLIDVSNMPSNLGKRAAAFSGLYLAF